MMARTGIDGEFGSIFQVDEDRRTEKGPRFKGFLDLTHEQKKALAAGGRLMVAVWEREGPNSGPYLRYAPTVLPPLDKKPGPGGDLDDDVPF
jgi:hypothetical protein